MLRIQHTLKCLLALVATFLASGCMNTTAVAPAPAENAIAVGQRIDHACQQQVLAREQAIRTSQAPAQFLALANQASSCLDNIRFHPQHPDTGAGMRLNALALVNYVKAGELDAAQKSLVRFKNRFREQDLVFSDYTSFIDTATALLQADISKRQLAMLNINSTLRSELNRKRQWSVR
ncbi:hypothetical protein PN836_001800 [Ningiella sp. W23]|uniref:hypothetical protein n=1 Tax=Ningiella sp. W23 TaxID=3023715 RepID=UPI003757777C